MEPTAAVSPTGRVPPGPSSWPLLGNLPDMRAAGDMANYFDLLWRRHGDTFRFKLLGTNAVALAHPEALKHVLSVRRERYVKGPIYDSVRSVLGKGSLRSRATHGRPGVRSRSRRSTGSRWRSSRRS